ncbi:GNAT family N-acetyltransferase [Paenibacillus turpanensis]|uniref:GNAT family N-acetyltransferase n=1 Tax=Paenibacillus turpanensis TaxID=2689078 RepID=UPI001409EECD|nr:GNAT family protein [Paenibacillus turpanensis]
MNESPFIKGQRLILRKPKEGDVQDYLHCERSIELVRMYGGDTRKMKPKTMDEAQKMIERILSNKYEWCIEYEGRFIGQARLTVQEQDRRARYAVGLFDSSVWGMGLGTEITQFVLQFAFEKLGLHRVDLRVLDYNHRAISCYEKCGFIKEGVEREGAWIEDKYETDVMMSILEREYHAIKPHFVRMKIIDDHS